MLDSPLADNTKIIAFSASLPPQLSRDLRIAHNAQRDKTWASYYSIVSNEIDTLRVAASRRNAHNTFKAGVAAIAAKSTITRVDPSASSPKSTRSKSKTTSNPPPANTSNVPQSPTTRYCVYHKNNSHNTADCRVLKAKREAQSKADKERNKAAGLHQVSGNTPTSS